MSSSSLRNSTSTHSTASSSAAAAAAAPLANAEDETTCECNDAGIYYYSNTAKNRALLDSIAEPAPAQPPTEPKTAAVPPNSAHMHLLSTGAADSSNILTGDSSDSGILLTSLTSSTSMYSTNLSAIAGGAAGGASSTLRRGSGQAGVAASTNFCDDDSEEDDDDNVEGFAERSSSSENSSGDDSAIKSLAGAAPPFIAGAAAGTNDCGGGLTRRRSLEALVSSFDQCLNAALGDMSRDVVKLSTDFDCINSTRKDNNNESVLLTQEELVTDDPLWLHLSHADTVQRLKEKESREWSQHVVREQLLLPALRLASATTIAPPPSFSVGEEEATNKTEAATEDDDEFAQFRDIHSLAGLYDTSGNLLLPITTQDREKLQTADEVIEEIDKIFDENNNSNAQQQISSAFGNNNTTRFRSSCATTASSAAADAAVANILNEIEEKLKSMPIPLYEDKLKDLNIPDLIELMADLDKLTQQFSEILVHELAVRDELQFEKEVRSNFCEQTKHVMRQRRELKLNELRAATAASSSNNNTINNKERQQQRRTANKFSQLKSPTSPFSPLTVPPPTSSWTRASPATTPMTNNNNSILSSPMSATTTTTTSLAHRYLLTAIPYQPGVSPKSLRHLQALNKILRAMSENSPTTTTLLTDYILNVLCPKDEDEEYNHRHRQGGRGLIREDDDDDL